MTGRDSSVSSLGDQIPSSFIRKIICPVHGRWCHGAGAEYFCRKRIDKAVERWHQDVLARRHGEEVWFG